MRLDRLELCGFMRFTEPVVLDLAAVPIGILAVVGENGAGKSTILDAGLAAPFLSFPSREGPLADYASDGAAYFEALYYVERLNSTYRLRVNVDGLKRSSDAVMELVMEGRRIPLNDGKVTTFKEQVARWLPPKELLLASAFAAQNRAGSFVALDRKGRKDLFSALLGLKHYERMAETARRCALLLEGGRMQLQAVRDALTRDTDPAIAHEQQARANDLQAEGGQAELRKVAIATEIASLSGARGELTDQAQAHLVAHERARALTETVASRDAAGARLDAERAAAVSHATRERSAADAHRKATLAEIDGQTDKERRACASVVADLDKRIANNQAALNDADAITAAAAAQAEAKATIAALRLSEGKSRQDLDLAREQVATRERMLRDAEGAERDLASARRASGMFTTVPCQGVGAYAACLFLTEAAAAAARIPDLEARAGHAPSLREGIETWSVRMTEHIDILAAVSARIADCERLVAHHEPKARLAPHLAVATERMQEYGRQRELRLKEETERLADLSRCAEQAVSSHAAACRDIATRHLSTVADLDAREATLVIELGEAQLELDAASAEAQATRDARSRLDAIEAQLTTAREDAAHAQAILAGVAAQIEALERDRQTYARKVAERDDVDRRLAEIGDELLAWQLLSKAFGRDGLPTLEIDAAGPTVSNLTNDLLSVCFGPRFTVELVTQEQTADGKGVKEAFSLRVFDNVAGGDTRDIGDLSGGERVIVEEALRAAIALFVNSRNEMPIRTCWRDETTGALDGENAVRYVAMLRRLQELGGFHHILFITHNSEAAALADARIVVADGKAEIVTTQKQAA